MPDHNIPERTIASKREIVRGTLTAGQCLANDAPGVIAEANATCPDGKVIHYTIVYTYRVKDA